MPSPSTVSLQQSCGALSVLRSMRAIPLFPAPSNTAPIPMATTAQETCSLFARLCLPTATVQRHILSNEYYSTIENRDYVMLKKTIAIALLLSLLTGLLPLASPLMAEAATTGGAISVSPQRLPLCLMPALRMSTPGSRQIGRILTESAVWYKQTPTSDPGTQGCTNTV